jgi:type II secretory pathway predicted ATPase ExeA
MRSSDLAHFALTVAPFSKEIDDADLWLPSSKQDLVDELTDTIEARGSALLVGDAGVGKTCVMRALRQRLPTDRFRLTYCHNATLGRRDFYRQLCLALGLKASATAAAVFYAVTTHVEELGRERMHPVFVIDEAHLLHPDVLDHLHILLNYDWDSRALLSIVLVGLPEIEERLSMRRNRSLYTRLHCRAVVDAHSADDTREYLQYRLKAAGAERDLFAVEALPELHDRTRGSLREIDRVATAALREAARKKRKLVSLDDVIAVVGARE